MEHVRQSYLTAQVSTVGQGDVVVLLFEKAIVCLTQAKEKIQEKNFAEKGLLISKAIDIINLLDASLNMEKGGTIAENLHNLYFYCNTQLLQANIKLDCDKIDAVIHTLSELNEAFSEAVKDPAAQAVADEIGRKLQNSGTEQRSMTTAPSAGAGSKAAKNAYSQVARSAGIEVENTENTQVENHTQVAEKTNTTGLNTLAFATALMANPTESYAKPTQVAKAQEQKIQNTAPMQNVLLPQNPLLSNVSATSSSQSVQSAPTAQKTLPTNSNPLLNSNIYTANTLKVENKTEEKIVENIAQNTNNKLVNPLAKKYMKASSAV